jgi:ATP-dependent Zn protease
MNDKIKNPLIQTMENPIWKSDQQKGGKAKNKKLILKATAVFLFLILLSLVVFLFLSNTNQESDQIQQKESNKVLVSPTPTLSLKSNYQQGVDEAEKDLESLDLFDESFYPPSIDNIVL